MGQIKNKPDKTKGENIKQPKGPNLNQPFTENLFINKRVLIPYTNHSCRKLQDVGQRKTNSKCSLSSGFRGTSNKGWERFLELTDIKYDT